MKTLNFDRSTYDSCMKAAQKDRVIVTRAGQPIALVVGLEDMDEEQLELSKSKKFWQLVAKWRKQPRYSLDEAEKMLGIPPTPLKNPPRKGKTKSKAVLTHRTPK
ncbi:MAG: hypothetical protein ACKV2Q_18925 [Planctomycetaceae bacterium]